MAQSYNKRDYIGICRDFCIIVDSHMSIYDCNNVDSFCSRTKAVAMAWKLPPVFVVSVKSSAFLWLLICAYHNYIVHIITKVKIF